MALQHPLQSAQCSAACLGPCPDTPGASLCWLHLMLVTTARDITGGGASQVTPGMRNINTRSSDRRYQCREQHLPVNSISVIMVDLVRFEEIELDTNNISPSDVERLRSLLPHEMQKTEENLTQLEIILEAIHYIKMLKTRLKSVSEH